MKKIDWLILFLLTVLSFWLLGDLFKPGLYTSHDGLHQVARFFYFDQALHDGQIPVRWAQGLMVGFGYPLFIFSYQMPWFMAEVFRILGSSIIESVKYTFLAGFILSAVTMYLFQKDVFGRMSAVVGTSLYLLAPFRFSNIFVRAAIGDATCFVFAPLVAWSLWKLKEKDEWKWVVVGSLGVSGLILSHAMVAALFLSIFLLYFLLSLASIKNKISYIKSSLIIFLAGFGVSAYYFLPSMLERSNTKFQELMGQVFLGNYFPTVSDLLYSKWGYGVFHAKEGAMSLQLGLVQWFCLALTIIYLVKILLFDKNTPGQKKLAKEGIILVILSAFTIFMMLPVSLPIWKFISGMVFVDFPWRYLSVLVFLSSLCAGLVVKLKKGLKVAFAVFLVISAFYFNRNHLHINEILPWDLSFILKLEKTTNSFDEYTPRWVKNEYITENHPRVEFSAGKAGIEILKDSSNLLEFSADPPETGTVRINTIYYPGWKVFIDGKEEKIDYSNGLIEFKVGEGKKNIVARFTETPLRLAGDIISLATLAFLFLPQIPMFRKAAKKFF